VHHAVKANHVGLLVCEVGELEQIGEGPSQGCIYDVIENTYPSSSSTVHSTGAVSQAHSGCVPSVHWAIRIWDDKNQKPEERI